MSNTFIYSIVGIVILHFVVGIGYLISKISAKNHPKRKDDLQIHLLREQDNTNLRPP